MSTPGQDLGFPSGVEAEVTPHAEQKFSLDFFLNFNTSSSLVPATNKKRTSYWEKNIGESAACRNAVFMLSKFPYRGKFKSCV